MDDRRLVLLLTHEEAGCRPIVSALKSFGFRTRTAADWETASTRWQRENHGLVFLDEDLVPHCLGPCLAALHGQSPPGQLVIVGDAPDMGDWVGYLNAGAIDLIPKRATASQVRHALDLAFSLDQPIENCG